MNIGKTADLRKSVCATLPRMTRSPRLFVWSVLFLLIAVLPARAEDAAKLPEYDIPEIPTHWKATAPAGHDAQPITDAMLRASGSDASSWLQYHGDYRGYRHSPLATLTPASAKNLQLAWVMPTGTVGQMEASPLVYDGVLYVTTSFNRLFALDAESGRVLWRYDHPQPADLRLCCGPPNRGVAIAGDLVLMATLDAKLLAFDRRTGELRWSQEVAPYQDGFSFTSAPLVVGDLAILGPGGGEFGVRGFIDAYDVKTGTRVWRHYTVPAKGEPGTETWEGTSYETGGVPAWTTGVYDVESDTLYWTTGNPSPDWNGDQREGDNLYSNSLLALDPHTGARKWYFQFTPHDVWDYDGNSQLFLVDVPFGGKAVKAAAQPNRNGYFYLIDRSDGRFLRATPYVEQVNWATIDAQGRPVVDPTKRPSEKPSERVCPGNMGGLNGAWTASYDPALGLAFVPEVEGCQQFLKGIPIFVKGIPFLAGTPVQIDARAGKTYGNVTAMDVATGRVRWRYRDPHPMIGGALSTAGGVVFTGNLDGDALALDAKTGAVAWRFHMGAGMRSQPIAWQSHGRAYVAIGAGNHAASTAYVGGPTQISDGGALFVFALPAK
jgi:alcohol dehydrogenase (cytochrome c)